MKKEILFLVFIVSLFLNSWINIEDYYYSYPDGRKIDIYSIINKIAVMPYECIEYKVLSYKNFSLMCSQHGNKIFTYKIGRASCRERV